MFSGAVRGAACSCSPVCPRAVCNTTCSRSPLSPLHPCTRSVTLWMAAAKLETGDEARKRVLLRALERIPQSVRLWKAVVEISDEDDARILLVGSALGKRAFVKKRV